MTTFTDWLMSKMGAWLLKDQPAPPTTYLSNFPLTCEKIRVGDVLLVQGHNRVSNIIRHITQSPWTHAALYIGRLDDIKDKNLIETVKLYNFNKENQLLIESELGYGTRITTLDRYAKEHIRILRPSGLTVSDAQKVIQYAIGRLGKSYDVRHILDLARFLFPWGLFPRKYRSSLFEHNALQPTKDICSSMIADAFQSVDYPILPLITKGYENKLELIPRNTRLYTPSDFDNSPYFDILKFPFFLLGHKGAYHKLPWIKDEMSDDDATIIFLSPDIAKFFTSPAYAVVGASANRNKFGNKVLLCYLQQNKKVYPINPREDTIAGLKCIKNIADLPDNVKSISIVTPPQVTEKIVAEAITKKIENIWMQPGAESDLAVQLCRNNHINVIAGGPCILQELRFHHP